MRPTVQRKVLDAYQVDFGLFHLLARTLRPTNPIESMIETSHHHAIPSTGGVGALVVQADMTEAGWQAVGADDSLVSAGAAEALSAIFGAEHSSRSGSKPEPTTPPAA